MGFVGCGVCPRDSTKLPRHNLQVTLGITLPAPTQDGQIHDDLATECHLCYSQTLQTENGT